MADQTTSANASSEASGQEQAQVNKTRKIRTGLVVSDKCDKTITVSVERRIKHPLYGKYIKRHKKFAAHDENNDCNVGDLVRITETRPLSRSKRWRLLDIVERAK